MGPRGDTVIGPDMIPVLGSQSADTNPHSTKVARVEVVSWGPSSPLAAKCALPIYDSIAIPQPEAMP